MIDPITNTNEYNSLSTEQSELDEVNHVRFHLTFKINYIQMKKRQKGGQNTTKKLKAKRQNRKQRTANKVYMP